MARILLVIGHYAFRDAITTTLERERNLHVIGEAGSVAECRTFLASGEGFDLAIVELSLPDGEGTELIEDLRDAHPNASLMVLTASMDPHDHARAESAGADEVLVPAISLEDLFEAVRRLAEP